MASATRTFPSTLVAIYAFSSSTFKDLATSSASRFVGYGNSRRHDTRTAPPTAARVKASRSMAGRMEIRFSRRAVLLTLLFGLIVVLGMAAFASLLTGSYEILALAPFSIFLWIVLFVWVAARLSRRERGGG